MINKIVSELSKFNPEVKISGTGSAYISFTGSKVKRVRISDHAGHKLKRNTWEIRSDAMTCRKSRNNNRVYNAKDIDKFIKEFR